MSNTKPNPLSLEAAFEVEEARREMERRQREDAERKQQEEDLARAERTPSTRWPPSRLSSRSTP